MWCGKLRSGHDNHLWGQVKLALADGVVLLYMGGVSLYILLFGLSQDIGAVACVLAKYVSLRKG